MKAITFNVEGLHHVMVNQLEVLMANPVFHISLPACEEVVHHGHLMAIHHEFVSQMGAHEACASSDLYWDSPRNNRDGMETKLWRKLNLWGNYPVLFFLTRTLVY